jgi:GntR family transcriptional regulator
MEFRLEVGNRAPIYRQLAEQIRESIATGRLQPDEKLPSVRELSRALVVNPNTIARVYTELERDGVLNTRPGLGVFVARRRTELTERARRKRLVQMLDGLLTEAVHLGFAAAEVQQLLEERSVRFRWDSSVTKQLQSSRDSL